MANYCKRVFQVETVQDLFYFAPEPYPFGLGPNRLQLSRWPLADAGQPAFNPISPLFFDLGEQSGVSVVQTTAAGVTQSLANGADFTADAERGWLYRLDSATGDATLGWEAWPTAVQYEAGYAQMPDDVVQCAVELATMEFKARGRDPLLRARDQAGPGREEFWVGGPPGGRGAFPQTIRDVLDDYRVPSAA